MTHLIREFLGESAHLEFPAIALLLFFTAFLVVLGKLLRGWLRHDSYDRVASLPFEEKSERGGSQ